jgi:hypothetical protein
MQIFDNGTCASSVDELVVQRGKKGDAYIYVVEFSTGTIKVGRGVNPKGRVQSHATTANLHGVDVTQCWVSEPHSTSFQSEDYLIAWCRTHGQQAAGREYFNGVTFEDTVGFACTLASLPAASNPEREARSERFFEEAKALLMGQHPSLFAKERVAVGEFLLASEEELRTFRQHELRQGWLRRAAEARTAAAQERAFLEAQGIDPQSIREPFSAKRPTRRLVRRLPSQRQPGSARVLHGR